MKAFLSSANGQLTLGLILVAAVFVAFAIGGDAGYGAVSAGLVLDFMLLVYFGASFILAVVVLARRG
jgi:hypothetical protein